MKVKINWKELGKQLWAAVKPVLLAAIGGGIVSGAAGCSSQGADASGGDENKPTQANPVTTIVPISAAP